RTDRDAEDTCVDRGRCHLRRTWSQVSDLGAGAFSRPSRGGHRESARAEEIARLQGQGTSRGIGMMAGRGIRPDAAGGPASHLPVMLREVLLQLAPRDGGLYIDATFGAGGYSRGILAAAHCEVIAIDRDQAAVAAGAALVDESEGRLTLVEDRFSRLERVAG